ncbi:NUDIX domain-containing protein [Planococcus sp. CPCC 101016]|uniref:NUDIX domain-containing protein n=1 Tax=Planococcus sp. CPCC 101016 TaxID=2599617 RepID=UPI001647D13B|nr:NUDIX domain-containing protein [Planococcus sp. CPCC 101016]
MLIRNSAKAIIIEDAKVLLTKNEDKEGYFYLFPGGGQEHGEVLSETVRRECIEELGQRVEVNELLHVREYIGKNHEHADFDGHVHQIEYYFVCQIKPPQTNTQLPTNPDSHQIGVEWLPIANLLDYRIYPKGIRKYVEEYKNSKRNKVYLGDIN